MQANVGMTDRWLRMPLGVALIIMVFVGPQTPWGWAGLYLLVTGVLRFCPLYRIFGISSCGL